VQLKVEYANILKVIKTHGLTHINLEVRDPEASLRFYERLFGVREYFRDEVSIQALGPGEHDVLAFVKGANAGRTGGISHFGFRLTEPAEIDNAVAAAVEAGARILRRGEFAPGLPYLYIEDPDGYEIEIWYE
jgi:catechol 2,3-dioxygenase-like lactoylglutathione lyase family enzyme